jgi:hypothetical protein
MERIRVTKEAMKRILVVVVSRRHHTNGLFQVKKTARCGGVTPLGTQTYPWCIISDTLSSIAYAIQRAQEERKKERMNE